MAEEKKAYDVKIKQLPKSEVEIKGSIPADTFDSFRGSAIKRLGKDVTVKGFRKGKAPEAVIVERAGEAMILEEMADLALNATYPQIIESEKIDAIGNPQVQITKIAMGNPLEFTLTTAVMPVVKLGDYKKIAKKENGNEKPVTVENTEVENIITEIRKRKVAQDKMLHESEAAQNEEKTLVEGEKIPETPKEEALPELTDEFVKTLGEFENVADFRAKLEENIKHEKEMKAREEKRERIIKGIVDASKIEVPEVLIHDEAHKMAHRFEHDLEHANLSIDDYLERTKTTKENLEKEWHEAGERKVRTQLVFETLIKEANIAVLDEELEAEVTRMLENYPEADRAQLRSYVGNTLLTAKIFEFLEEQK